LELGPVLPGFRDMTMVHRRQTDDRLLRIPMVTGCDGVFFRSLYSRNLQQLSFLQFGLSLGPNLPCLQIRS